MIKASETKLWNLYDKKGTLLYTKFPNCLYEDVVSGFFSLCELRVIFFIVRMSFGFGREATRWLGLDDFEEDTCMSSPQLSINIRKLLRERTIFRNSKNGDKYMYAINLLPYGVKMKYYKYSNDDYEILNADKCFDNVDYQIVNSNGEKMRAI